MDDKVIVKMTTDQIKRALSVLSQGKYSQVADVITALVSAMKVKVKEE